MSIVNSHNEWDPLEEVIVGAGIPPTLPALDFTFKLFFHDNIYHFTRSPGDTTTNKLTPQHYITQRHVEEHHEDIENYVDVLRSCGVDVKRPKTPNKIIKTKTPGWESTIYPALNVRDLTIIIGNEIIETPPSLRFRYFENDYMKHLFLDYFNNGAKWTVTPRPLMLDSSFDLSYFEKDIGAKEYYDQIKRDDQSGMDCGHEIMFDAANCMRLGTHILFNTSSKNADMGVDWLQRHLGEKYTVWPVNLTDTHIDSIFLPLRPGLALFLRPDLKHLLPKPLQKWDLIDVPLRYRDEQSVINQGIRLASPRIELNVLSVSQNKLICHPEYIPLLEKHLKGYDMDLIPSRIRHCEIFAGAHHCLTLDVRRAGGLENYFD